jgi:hypothetical protein
LPDGIFSNKNTNAGTFWGAVELICRYILWPVGIYTHIWVNFNALWYILLSIGIHFPVWSVGPRKIWPPLPWRRGAVDIASASGTRRPGYESRKGIRFFRET